MGSSWRKHRLANILFLAVQVCSVISDSGSSNPCDNFYEYACKIPAEQQEYVSLVKQAQNNVIQNLKHAIQNVNNESNLELFKKWQTFLSSCKKTESINAQGITPLISILNNLGGWPLTNSMNTDNLPKLQDILSFYGKIKVFPLFEVMVHGDKFHKKNKIMIRQPRTTFLEGVEKAFQQDVNRYSNFSKTIIETIVLTNQTQLSQEAAAIASEIVAFEIELSKILTSSYELNIYKPMTLKDFQSKINQDVVNWKKIINDLSTVELVSDEDKIDVSTDSYYPKLVKLLQETPIRTVLNYIHWRFIVQYLPYTSDDLRSLYFENSDLLQYPAQESTRPNSCVFESALGSILSYQYAKDYITPDIEVSVHQILNNVKQATIDIIKESWLLKEDEKIAAENKVSKMKFVFGISENAKNYENISKFYESWTVGDNYFNNILSLRNFSTIKELEKIHKNEFIDSSAENFMRITNLLSIGFDYEFLDNTVYIKPENLAYPLFSSNGSEVQKYGLLGYTIASGIIIAFVEADSIESYIDGRFKKLYSFETLEAFWNSTACFENQFNNDSVGISSSTDNLDIDWARYNMADTPAIQIAYRAFRTKQSFEVSLENSREFFTLFVKLICRPELQEFSTEWSLRLTKLQYRVMGSLPNVPQFAEAFACPRGARMNPETKCSFLM